MSYQTSSPFTTYPYPGQAILWPFSPEPHLAVNPWAAGPACVGVGCTGGACGCGGACGGGVGITAEEEYAQTGWGMVALVGAGSFLGGILVGWTAAGMQRRAG